MFVKESRLVELLRCAKLCGSKDLRSVDRVKVERHVRQLGSGTGKSEP